jgi:uncharacterized protein (TIRG00374 family)
MVKWRSLLVGGAISAVCLVLLLRTVDLGRTRDAFAQADPAWLACALALIVASLLMRCWRWQLLFLPNDRVSLRGTLGATLIGYMFNTVLPGRVGELARAALIGQTDRVSTARAVGTILIEKILDVLALLILLGGLLSVMPLPPEVSAAGKSAALAFGVLALGLVLASVYRGPLVRWAERRLDPLPLLQRLRPSRIIHLVLDATDGLRRPELALAQLITTTALWGLALLTVMAVMRAFHLDVPPAAAALVLVTTNLGMTVPSAPGYVGVYHYIAVVTLRFFGVDDAVSLSFAVALHALGFGTFTLAGALVLMAGLARQRYELADLWRWQDRTAKAPSAA